MIECVEKAFFVRWCGYKGIPVSEISFKNVKDYFPNLIVFLDDKVLFIEIQGESIAKNQKKYIKIIEGLGHSVKVCKGCKGAIEFVEEFI